jgi:hypothetical protein
MAWRSRSVRSATVVVVFSVTTGAGANAGGLGKAAAKDTRVWSSQPQQLLWGAMSDETRYRESETRWKYEWMEGDWEREQAATDRQLEVTRTS